MPNVAKLTIAAAKSDRLAYKKNRAEGRVRIIKVSKGTIDVLEIC